VRSDGRGLMPEPRRYRPHVTLAYCHGTRISMSPTSCRRRRVPNATGSSSTISACIPRARPGGQPLCRGSGLSADRLKPENRKAHPKARFPYRSEPNRLSRISRGSSLRPGD
jgi:hypothetical protein